MRKRQSEVLADLRRKRSRVHRVLDRLEPRVAEYEAKLAELEAAIQALSPELQLHPRRYKPNPYFARGELPRLTLAIMREAGEPLAVRTVAIRALAAKGIVLPDPHAMKLTRLRLHQTFVIWRRRGLVVAVGEKRDGKQALSGQASALPVAAPVHAGPGR